MTIGPKVALFVDSENASAAHLPEYLELCRKLGRLIIARCYGGSVGLKKWEKAIAEHHLVPILMPPSANKQNASDFALTIDVVSLLHRDKFDHAVIASSDADFTLLAIHIREHGKGVDGIGEAKATRKFQTAFDNFTEVGARQSPKAHASGKTAGGRSAAVLTIDKDRLVSIFRQHDSAAKPLTVQEFGKVLTAHLGAGYRKGHGTLTTFLRKSQAFEVNGNVVSLRKV
jgi:hypothetical protein